MRDPNALDPDRKSGHYVSDPPSKCWCDRVHHYAKEKS